MTRKDYILIAQELLKIDPSSLNNDVINALCFAFKRDNHKFDGDKFRKYIQSWKEHYKWTRSLKYQVK